MNNLKNLRSKVDDIDSQILSLIKKRLNLVTKIGQYKKENNIKIKDLKREKEVLDKIVKKAEEFNLSGIFIKKIWQILFKESYRQEK